MAKAPTKTASPVMAGAPGETISVRGPEDGRYRAGIKFGPIATTVDLSTVTPEQLALIEGDAALRIKRPAAPAPAAVEK
jgi:hypothetical protein